jgi:hypothetical protein
MQTIVQNTKYLKFTDLKVRDVIHHKKLGPLQVLKIDTTIKQIFLLTIFENKNCFVLDKNMCIVNTNMNIDFSKHPELTQEFIQKHKKLNNIQLGDTVFSYNGKKGKIVGIKDGYYPNLVAFENVIGSFSFTKEGKFYSDDDFITIYQ